MTEEKKRIDRMSRTVVVSALALVLAQALVALFMSLSPAPVMGKELEGKRVLMVVAPEGYKEDELSVPSGIFKELGAEVVVASTRTCTGIARGMSGGEVAVNLSIGDVNLSELESEYDAIVIVGGVGSMRYLWDDSDLRNMVRAAYDSHKTVAAICLSPVVLARAGILQDKECTAFITAKEELIKNGGKYLDKGVVVSGNIVTAKGPEYATEFAIAVADVMMNRSSNIRRLYETETPSPKPAAGGFTMSLVAVAIAVAVVFVSFALRWRR